MSTCATPPTTYSCTAVTYSGKIFSRFVSATGGVVEGTKVAQGTYTASPTTYTGALATYANACAAASECAYGAYSSNGNAFDLHYRTDQCKYFLYMIRLTMSITNTRSRSLGVCCLHSKRKERLQLQCSSLLCGHWKWMVYLG
jgi:hypothetical protein